MSDFNFDELDKAVNNVLGDKAARQEAGLMTSEKKTDVVAPTVSATPVVVSDAPAAVSPTQSVVKPRSSINRGPGSVSVPVTKGVIDIMAPPSKRPSRESTPIAPVRPTVSISVPTKHIAPTLDVPEKIAPTTEIGENTNSLDGLAVPSAPTPTSNDESLERFDALSRSGFDFDEPKTSAQKDTADATAPGIIEAQPAEVSNDDQDQASTGSQSPFLSGAKVEKRPLGSYASAAALDSLTDSPPVPAIETPELAVESKPVTSSVIVNDQKETSDLETKVENDTDKPAFSKRVPLADASSLHTEFERLLADMKKQQPSDATVETAPRTSTSLGKLDSIPQQYKAADKGDKDDATSPVFDTKEYHNSHEAKSDGKGGNGLLIASIILLVLALAAAAGIFLYGDRLGL